MDNQARWVRKGKTYRYGYKKHVLTDEQGLVEAVIITSANTSDTLMLPDLVDKAELSAGTSLLADKGYSSQKNSEFLVQHDIVNGIMLKASRSKPLRASQKAFNRLVSKTRCLIERTFGSIRLWFNGGRCRYRGLEKTHTQNILEAMAYNLKRMPRLLMEEQIRQTTSQTEIQSQTYAKITHGAECQMSKISPISIAESIEIGEKSNPIERSKKATIRNE